MTSLPIGMVLLLLTAILATSGANINQYFQTHSFWLVGFGSVALLFLIFPTSAIKNLYYSVKSLFQNDLSLTSFSDSIKKLSQNKQSTVTEKNEIIEYAQLLWDQGVGADMFIVLLSEKRNELEAKNVDVIHSLKNLSKYPPALGMVGTVMGMIDLFMTLDKNQDRIGEALSVAMTATLLGLIISNFIISPLADRLHVKHLKEQRLNTTLYELLLLVNANQPISLISEEIRSRAS